MTDQAPERVPPYSEEAERGVLGSIMVDQDCLHDVRGRIKLTPEMFYVPSHRAVLDTMYAMADESDVVDMITLGQRLKDANVLEKMGGVVALERIVDSTPTSAHVEYYAQIVKQKYTTRAFIQLLRAGLEDAYSYPEIDKTMSKTANALNDLTHGRIEIERSNVEVFDELMKRWEHAHERRVNGEEAPLLGLKTPFGRLDDLLCGLQPGLHFIAAPPNAGKTCVEGQLSEYVASTEGAVLRFYLDDTHEDAIARSASRIGGVALAKLQHGFATNRDLDKIREDVRPMIEAMQVYIREDVETVEQIQVLSRLYKAKHDIKLITVDYVQILDSEAAQRAQQERDRLAAVCTGLKRLWKELRLPIVVLSQVGRENYKADANPRKASMSELFGAAVLEHTASSVTILKTLKEDDVPPQPLDDTGHSHKHPVAMHLVKNKHGPKGMACLWFYPKYFKFENTPRIMKGNVPFYMTWEEHIEQEGGALADHDDY